MAWYYILFLILLVYFVIKTVLVWFLGDFDIDFDADGDVDFDFTSLLSFKGIMHFLLGFSGYLSAVARLCSDYSGQAVASFSPLQYAIATGVGFALMIALWYMYKMMMKLTHVPDDPKIVGRKCIVTLNRGNGEYVVGVQTPQGTFTREVISNDENIPLGSERTVKWSEDGDRYQI